MNWCEAIVHTTSAGSDVVSDWMIRFGATGTEIVDRADVPDPAKPGVYWELYDPKMLAAMTAVEKIRAAFPDAAFTTDVIVGFPGETEAEFEQTEAFCQRVGFLKIHVFPFSPREGTPAAEMPMVVAQKPLRAR